MTVIREAHTNRAQPLHSINSIENYLQIRVYSKNLNLYHCTYSYHVMFLVEGGLEDLAPVDSIRGIGYFKLLDRNIIKSQFIETRAE